jgi:hypothetical protein
VALPSFATRPPAAQSKLVAMTDSENVAPASPLSAAGLIARAKANMADGSDSRVAQLVASKVFLVRVASDAALPPG